MIILWTDLFVASVKKIVFSVMMTGIVYCQIQAITFNMAKSINVLTAAKTV